MWRHPKLEGRQIFTGSKEDCEAVKVYVESPEIRHHIRCDSPLLTSGRYRSAGIVVRHLQHEADKIKVRSTFGAVVAAEVERRLDTGAMGTRTAATHRRRLAGELADWGPIDVTAITADLCNRKRKILLSTATASVATSAMVTILMALKTA